MATFRLALISMPWPLANRPSIQLGTLKSFLKAKAPDMQVDCYHPYVEVANLLGIREYNAIAERTWVAESIYACLLNPKKRPEILDLVSREHDAKAKNPLPELETISSRILRLHQHQHWSLPWSSYDLIGFSISLSQLTSSLYMIKQLRSLHPGCLIVVGGSSCAGELGHSMLANVPQIDFLIDGEGELPLLELINRLKEGDLEGGDFPGLLWRDAQGHVRGGGFNQLQHLNELAVPDYNDYFQELSRQPRLSNLVPNLPVETSRGCWWHRTRSGSVDRACRFCNLNLQWRGYRSKKPLQVAAEMEELAAKHTSLKFFFVDNILDTDKINELFSCIHGLGRDFEIFTELRASVSRQQLIRMRRAGVTQVQIGVEALSTRLLQKINKGTTTIQNIETIKHCEELGIQHLSNLMLGFPGSDEEDVAETLDNLKFVAPYQPLRKVRFWLGQNSPVALHPEQHGIRRIANHPYYQSLLPDSLGTSLCLMIKTYIGDRTRQKRLWRPVARELSLWQKQYQSLRRQHFPAPLLSYRDGGDFLLIRRRNSGTEMETFRLRGSSRAIYRFCETRRSLRKISSQFPRFSSDQLQHFIADMVDKRLMFQEGKQVLSLAINEEPHLALCDASTRERGDATQPELGLAGGRAR
jgi:ribosomal peptide maturation radical SAM protein 1